MYAVEGGHLETVKELMKNTFLNYNSEVKVRMFIYACLRMHFNFLIFQQVGSGGNLYHFLAATHSNRVKDMAELLIMQNDCCLLDAVDKNVSPG